ncbi:MAG: WecB/TagA/CpsF family glycosyltransferase, partial [Bacteroidetes bacterium]|nr:WecB/TagA/CpsF family glycosyltransferase [Bacteroidota bacterium]
MPIHAIGIFFFKIFRIGLEWLHRLLHEPRRLWRRY